MGKQENLRRKLLNLLPKAASPVTFLNPPPSPVSPVKAKSRKGCSSPAVSLVPREVRRRATNESFDAREPTSPKVSCTGQVMKSKKSYKTRNKSNPQESSVMRVSRGKQPCQKLDDIDPDEKTPTVERVPSLCSMKQLGSGRGVLSNFNLMSIGFTEEADCSQNDRDEDKERVIVVCSEPQVIDEEIVRKEVNLWKRRTLLPPRPLKL